MKQSDLHRNLAAAMLLALSVLAVSLLAAPALSAQQAPAPPSAKMPAQAPAQSGSNPFPEDTSSVPILPSKTEAGTLPGDYDAASSAPVHLPGNEADPVRSPDDGATEEASSSEQGFSSSSAGLDSILPDTSTPDAPNGKRRKGRNAEPAPHVETAQEDLTVARYYLDNKNWRAALSRYQSALVLSPDEPDVYWGLAESQRHLGDFADARANYQKVIDYDPDSKHAKDAAKLLKSAELANAKAQAASTPAH